MKNFFKKIEVVAIITFIITLLTGCGNLNSIVGTFEALDNGKVRNDIYYTFNKDNTGGYTFYGQTKNFIYEDRGNKVIISYEGATSPNEFDYSIKDNILTIKDSFGSDVQYKRK